MSSSLSTFQHFPPPTNSNPFAQLCEHDTQLLSGSVAPPRAEQLRAQLPQLQDHLLAAAQPPRLQLGDANGVARAAFLPPKGLRGAHGGEGDESSANGQVVAVKKAFQAWLDEGWLSALETFATTDPSHLKWWSLSRMTSFVAQSLLGLYRVTHNIHSSFNPHLMMSGEDMVSEFSTTRDWRHAQIRALAWHPHTLKMAVAMGDDTIQVLGKALPTSPLLKYKAQRGIACLAWRPLNASELAVGCLSGLLLWTVEPTSVAARPSASCVTLLQAEGHKPVTAVQWDPRGKLLLSSSAADTSMILWNTASETKVPLRRVGGGGVHLVLWSPFSLAAQTEGPGRVLAATPTTVFRVWETEMWTPERWNVPEGRIQTACWSPCGNLLLFCTSEDFMLYALDFGDSGTTSSAVPVADLSEIEPDGEKIGGSVQCLRWDPLGERLAMTFRNSNLIALFSASLNPSLSLAPIGLIRGAVEDNETPSVIEFAAKFDEGALLTVGWSSGRLEHIPLLFVPNVNNPRVVQENIVLNPDFESSFTHGVEDPFLFTTPR